MKRAVKYQIGDYDKFKNSLANYVDTTVDCKDRSFDTSSIKTEYFGVFELEHFTIYHQSCELMVTGQIVENELIVNYRYPNRLKSYFDIILFTIVGVNIMYDINFFIGLAVVIAVFAHKAFVFNSEIKKKNEFLRMLEGMINGGSAILSPL